MPPTRTHIRSTVEAYLARHPHERTALAGLSAVLDGPGDPCSRTALPGHVTCSAVVIDRDRRVLHLGHKATGLLLAPGGHVEASDRTLLAAALRELHEEAGIQPVSLCPTPQFLSAPIDIDVHDIDANPAKGEPTHQHYDFRFAFYLAADQPPAIALQDEEVAGAEWRPFADVSSPTLRAKLLEAGLDGRPEPVNASVLIHDDAGRYLLHLRDNHPDIWEPGTFALLGGGRKPGDPSLEATIRRELAEGVPGLHLPDLTPFTVEEATNVDGLCVPIQTFSGRWNGSPDTLQLNEGVLLHWFPLEMLHRLRLPPSTADLLHRHATQHPPQAEAPQSPAAGGTVRNVIGVHLYLEDDEGRILLGLRHPDSAYAGRTWHFLAGHCERESAVQCLVREALEEAGLVIGPADVEHAHTVHLRDNAGAEPRMQIVFRVRRWKGTPEVRESDKCLGWKWWSPKALPQTIVPYARWAIEQVLAGQPYSEMGW
ncbi:NUDIX domain-containing protein [Streptomyces colonosanans]|uniref:NUDIX hydrolase n=1 Tax=Streptomyces colonosanans TaxID=1428652 RepID=A0A1S2PA59_9ACTN|nr:NUDIX domain-containing protein [Streptomyces colonosanans]OIJ90442.1 NUDIX hydrolase [Streptomyces colonosanans]